MVYLYSLLPNFGFYRLKGTTRYLYAMFINRHGSLIGMIG